MGRHFFFPFLPPLVLTLTRYFSDYGNLAIRGTDQTVLCTTDDLSFSSLGVDALAKQISPFLSIFLHLFTLIFTFNYSCTLVDFSLCRNLFGLYGR